MNWLNLPLAIASGGLLVASVVILHFMRLTHALRESEARWKFAIEGAGDGVWDWDVQLDKVIFSQHYKDMLGFTDEDIIVHAEAWNHRIHADDRRLVDEELRACLDGLSRNYYNEHRVICRDGRIKWVLARGMIVSRMPDGKPQRMIGTLADITDRKNMDERVRHMAHYDLLTDLPNRGLMSERLQQAVIKARRDKTQMAVMFLDLDKFKPVNDNLGHDIGDLLLKQVAQRLLHSMRAADTVARLGGDEFVVLLHAIDNKKDAVVVAEKILHALNEPFIIAEHEISISGSIGIAAYPQHGEDEKLLLINADIAMYHAKKEGRNDYCFFAAGM